MTKVAQKKEYSRSIVIEIGLPGETVLPENLEQCSRIGCKSWIHIESDDQDTVSDHDLNVISRSNKDSETIIIDILIPDQTKEARVEKKKDQEIKTKKVSRSKKIDV